MAKFMENENPRESSGGPKGPKGSAEFGSANKTGGLRDAPGGEFSMACDGTAEQKAKMIKVSR